MPTYEFGCPNGHTFDHFWRKMSAALPELPCPVCGAVAQRKVSGGAGLLFKGSGFYITDYGKDGKKRAAQPEQAKAAGESSPAGGKEGGGTTAGGGAAESGSSASAGAEQKPAAPKGDSHS